MPGGLLNLVSYGNQNVILNGNPTKTFYKSVYSKYTNFGLQKFRVDFKGLRTLRMNEESQFTFKIPRYADLLMDTFVVVNLPTIWSPIFPPQDCSSSWAPYEFKWVDNLGTQMIKEVTISVGGQILQKMSGQYLLNKVKRDFSGISRFLYNRMTGNVDELNDPANANGRVNQYPNAFFTTATEGPGPSISSRRLYIPINSWFTLTSQQAFPLVSLQYNELEIKVVMRPIRELYTILPPPSIGEPYSGGERYYIQSQGSKPLQGFYRFLQPPPDVSLNTYDDIRTDWNADIHLMCTYCFLSEEEVRVFAAKDQEYLIKEVYEYKFPNVTGSQRVMLNSLSMVSSYMWYFQRSDINLRNQWSNYTNWPYTNEPNLPVYAPMTGDWDPNGCGTLGPGANYNPVTGAADVSSGIYITGDYRAGNSRMIMEDWALLLDGKYRENTLDAGVLDYVEKYIRTGGDAPEGVYCYNFCLDTNPFVLQPSGAINMSKFSKIQFEFTTAYPALDASAQTFVICDPSSGDILGINKPVWRIYDYNYDLTVFEERYNTVMFTCGNVGLMYARS